MYLTCKNNARVLSKSCSQTMGYKTLSINYKDVIKNFFTSKLTVCRQKNYYQVFLKFYVALKILYPFDGLKIVNAF